MGSVPFWRLNVCLRNAAKQLHDGVIVLQARLGANSNSLHLEGEILQFPLAFDLKDDRITRPEIADQGLEL